MPDARYGLARGRRDRVALRCHERAPWAVRCVRHGVAFGLGLAVFETSPELGVTWRRLGAGLAVAVKSTPPKMPNVIRGSAVLAKSWQCAKRVQGWQR